MDFDYLDFIAWVDRCMFPADLSNDLQKLGLDKGTAIYYEIQWKKQNMEDHHFKIMHIWQAYCLGDKANDSRDGKNMGFYLKIWLEDMHKTWNSYKQDYTMSQILKKGTLTEVFHLGLETTEDICKRLIQQHRKSNRALKLPKGYNNFIELFEEELFETYILINGTIYEIDEVELKEIYEAKQNGNGQYEYTVKYNDGAISHSEAIREAIDTIR